MPLRYAYNTNGCTNHRLKDAIELMSEAGYDGIALTLDWHHLDPFARDWERRAERVKRQLDYHDLGCVIETGARYLLSSREKHEPTLINPTEMGRRKRVDFLKRALDIGALLEVETVSFWAGVVPPVPPEGGVLPRGEQRISREQAWIWLREGVAELLDHADEVGCELSLEPEPGMLIETNRQYEELVSSLDETGEHLRLALDLGHVWVVPPSPPKGSDASSLMKMNNFPGASKGGVLPPKGGMTWEEVDKLIAPAAEVYRYANRLGTVSIEGMDRGVHFHRPLHEGDMPIPPLIEALQAVEYDRLVCVELSRESPRAHLAIPESIAFLKKTEQVLAAQ